jgi:hypothetical protein
MNIQQFAEQHRVHARKDSCGDFIIPGFQQDKALPKRQEYRSHIYDNGGGQFGVCLVLPEGSAKAWNNRKRWFLEAGFTLKQDGDAEGTLLFDPTNEAQVNLALDVCRINPIHTPSPAQQEVLDRIRTGQRTINFDDEAPVEAS